MSTTMATTTTTTNQPAHDTNNGMKTFSTKAIRAQTEENTRPLTQFRQANSDEVFSSSHSGSIHQLWIEFVAGLFPHWIINDWKMIVVLPKQCRAKNDKRIMMMEMTLTVNWFVIWRTGDTFRPGGVLSKPIWRFASSSIATATLMNGWWFSSSLNPWLANFHGDGFPVSTESNSILHAFRHCHQSRSAEGYKNMRKKNVTTSWYANRYRTKPSLRATRPYFSLYRQLFILHSSFAFVRIHRTPPLCRQCAKRPITKFPGNA